MKLTRRNGRAPDITTFDINAACCGYLYGLKLAHDHVAQDPSARVLLVTAEVLSPLVDMQNVDTACLFGDAATATIIESAGTFSDKGLVVRRPLTAGTPDVGEYLKVPLAGAGYIEMNGRATFVEAVKAMTLLKTLYDKGLIDNQKGWDARVAAAKASSAVTSPTIASTMLFGTKYWRWKACRSSRVIAAMVSAVPP